MSNVATTTTAQALPLQPLFWRSNRTPHSGNQIPACFCGNSYAFSNCQLPGTVTVTITITITMTATAITKFWRPNHEKAYHVGRN